MTREAGTERPFTGDHEVSPTPGTYHCIACDAKLFDNDTKFDSGCGWPSFDRPYDDAAIEEHAETTLVLTPTGGVKARKHSYDN